MLANLLILMSVLAVHRLCAYAFLLNDSFNHSVQLLHLHGIETKHILSFGVGVYAATSTAIKFFKNLIARNKALDVFSTEASAWLTKTIALGVSGFYSTTFLSSEKLKALPSFWRVLFLTDYTSSALIGTMILMWLNKQVDESEICPSATFWSLCKSLFNATYNMPEALSNITLHNLFPAFLFITLFHLGFLIEHSKKKIPLSRTKEGTYMSLLLIKIRSLGMFPMILTSWLLKFQMKLFERIYLVYIPLGAQEEMLDFVSDAETIIGFFLYTVQAFYFLLLYSVWSFKTPNLYDQLYDAQALLTKIEPGLPTKKYLGKICSKLELLEICYILIVCLTSKLLYLEYNGLPVFNEYSLLTYSRTMFVIINNLKSFINLTNTKSVEKHTLFRM